MSDFKRYTGPRVVTRQPPEACVRKHTLLVTKGSSTPCARKHISPALLKQRKLSLFPISSFNNALVMSPSYVIKGPPFAIEITFPDDDGFLLRNQNHRYYDFSCDAASLLANDIVLPPLGPERCSRKTNANYLFWRFC